MATESEFAFTNYDFNAGGAGNQEPQAGWMHDMTKDGWEIVTASASHPYLAVLWQRPVGKAKSESKAEDTSKLKDDLAKVQAARQAAEQRAHDLEAVVAEAQKTKTEALDAMDQAVKDRDKAVKERDAAVAERDKLTKDIKAPAEDKKL